MGKENILCKRCKKNEADPGYVTCQKCRDKDNERKKADYSFYVKMGICPVCHKVKLFGDEATCLECRAKKANSIQKYRDVNKQKFNEYMRNYSKAKYDYSKKNGVCYMCGVRTEVGKALCKRCLKKRNESVKERNLRKNYYITREDRSDYGLCYYCGKPAIEGNTVCEDCRAKRAEIGKRTVVKKDHPWSRANNSTSIRKDKHDELQRNLDDGMELSKEIPSSEK